MRRLSHLSLHLALGLSASLFMAAPIYAQDLGTYRPGQAYQSVTSPGADVCNNHCAGDAQCRAWNYVKVNPKAPGVCEFLASASAPVQSPISISGENISQTSFARPVSRGGANTIRVGTSALSKPATPSVAQITPNRRVVRESVPQRIQPQVSADHRSQDRRRQVANPQSLTAQQNQYRRQTGDLQRGQATNQEQNQELRQASAPQQLRARGVGQQPQQFAQPQLQGAQSQGAQSLQQQLQFRPFLDSAGSSAPAQNPQAYQNQTQPRAQQPFVQRPFTQQKPVQGGQNYPQNFGQQGNQQGNQQGGQQGRQQSQAPQASPFSRPASLPRASANAPVTQQNAQAAYARRQADLAAIASGNSVDPIQQSLYGTLNDDVKVPTALRVLPSDPDAPIATSASRPVGPVQTQALRPAAGGQLAGGPR